MKVKQIKEERIILLRSFSMIFFNLLAIFPAVLSCTMYKEMQALKKPRYEVGEYKGAKYCADCHQEIYEQWLQKNSPSGQK